MARRIDGLIKFSSRWWLAGALLALGCVPTRSDRPGKGESAPVNGRQTNSTAKPAETPPPRYTLPTNYGDGVRRVRVLRDELREGWTKDNHEQVHEPLHELAPLLRELPRLLDKQELGEAERTETLRAIHDLFHMFSQIDSKLHSGFGASYDDLADSIDAAIEKLQPPPGPRGS